jgi:hypothetical protein
MLWVVVVVFFIVDALLIALVLRKVMLKRTGAAGATLGGLTQFTSVAAEETRNYMGGNYGGDPKSLPGVLQGLVDRLAARAAEQGLRLDRRTLKQFAALSVISVGSATARDVRSAIDSVH